MVFSISLCAVAVVILCNTASFVTGHSDSEGSNNAVLHISLPLLASAVVLIGIVFTVFGCCWYTKMRENSLRRVGQQYEVFADVMANRMAQQQEDQQQQQQQQQQQGGAAEGGVDAPGEISEGRPLMAAGAKMDKKQMFQAMMEAKHAKEAQKKYGYTRVSNPQSTFPPPPSQADNEDDDDDDDDGATERTPFPV